MTDGDILTDLRAWRDEFARAHGYDLGSIGAALRALDAANGSRVMQGEPRRPAQPSSPKVGTPNRSHGPPT